MTQRFDPDFDDCALNEGWLTASYTPPQPGTYGDFTIKSWLQAVGMACGKPINLEGPVVTHGLFDATGQMWMSDTPQERLMMYNDAIISRGRVLVGGLGLGVYQNPPACNGVGWQESVPAVDPCRFWSTSPEGNSSDLAETGAKLPD